MWPWEHAAVGYVCYSTARRVLAGESPRGDPVLALAVGTQFPDLVDKTLSWGLEVFPTGYAVGHSMLVGVPAGLAAIALAERRGHRPGAVAFVFGHWSHIAADVVAPLRRGEDLGVDRALWPIVTNEPYATDLGLRRGVRYLQEYVIELAHADVGTVVVLHLGLTLLSVALWLVDGAPGLRALGGHLQRVARSGRRR
jgi:hypothetical protein